jgi:hypothetical protein
MEKLTDKLDNLFAAVTFAEAGEFETAKEFLKKKRILVVLKDENVDSNTLSYAINACKRVKTGLDILYLGKQMPDVLNRFIDEAKQQGIDVIATCKNGGDIKTEIVNYSNTKSDVMYVIVESSNEIEVSTNKKELKEPLNSLPCPLVIVKEGVFNN